MSTILDTISDYFDRDLCASDDCLNAPKPGDGGQAPLFEIAIGKWSKISESKKFCVLFILKIFYKYNSNHLRS